jgi:hypothetical protein
MAAPTAQTHSPGVAAGPPAELADVFDLDPTQQDMGSLGIWLSGDEDEGDTTGDGCGESPPQGPTTGC